MLNRQIDICMRYMQAVFRHGIEPMEPQNFSPDWADQPSRYKVYREVERFPLPARVPGKVASMADIMQRISAPASTPKRLDLTDLSTLFLFAHGILNRRFDVNWNRDEDERSRYYQTTFGRGTASGGGRYPTELFWVCGPDSSHQPGIYQYDPAHHALARLFVGDITQRIRAALHEHPTALATDQFLLLSLNFWKNSFKYNSYAYHVVTEDLGALLGSLRFLAVGLESDFPFLFWYDDEALNQLLGLETLLESVFVVIPLPNGKANDTPAEKSKPFQKLAVPLVTKPTFQRSKRMQNFPSVEEVHLSALITAEARPEEDNVSRASCAECSTSGECIALPIAEPGLLASDLLDVFRRRRSSFGRFSSSQSLALSRFATLLSFASACRGYHSDIKQADGTPYFTRLMAFVNNVEDLQRGSYAYDSQQHCLWEVARQDFSLFLQEHYFLRNYNLAEAAALIVIVGKPQSMLEVCGNRGYRILNAEVGLVAQSIYLASTALDVNCGAALGFDNLALNQALGLGGTEEQSLLFLLVGYGLQDNATFDGQLV